MPQTKKHTLDALLAETAAGDADAFSQLYRETSSAVFAYALSLLKNRQDAEDALQDCFLAIRASATQYEPGTKPMAWIMAITRHLCLKQLQKQKRTVELVPEMYADTGTADPDTKLVIQACLNKLSDQERQIVVLHAVSGIKHREVAEVMGLPLSTVLSKYRRALKKMKTYLGKER